MKLIILLSCFITSVICAPKVGKLGIIHGEEVKANSKPFQVYLEAEYLFFSQYCSGSIITSRDVITTARCVVSADHVNVIAGIHNTEKDEAHSRIFRKSFDIRIHEDYDYDYENNIAILKLDEPLTFNNYISKIPLNLNHGNLLGKTVEISGWGGESYQYLESTVLRKASATFVNISVCVAHEFEMADVDVCLSGINGATICYADGGGPVVSNGELIAILSPKDYECGRWRSFSAVDIARFSSWIQKNVEDDAKLII